MNVKGTRESTQHVSSILAQQLEGISVTRSSLDQVVYEALVALGGSANLVDIARYIWNQHKGQLESSGDLFYTWQYDMRWSAQRLRKCGKMRQVAQSPAGVWEIDRLTNLGDG